MYNDVRLTASATLPRGEPRVAFHHLTWNAYQDILQVLNHYPRNLRLVYDHGILEMTMPLEEYESTNRWIERSICILVVEMGLKIKTMGSTTLNFPHLEKSAEPDSCYYIQNQSKVAGKKVDLTRDPPPDLVVEVDLTHSDINKLHLYASMGIPEFWRYQAPIWQVYQLQGQQYVEVEFSPTFPWLEKVRFYQFLVQCETDEVAAEKAFRAWVQEQVTNQRRAGEKMPASVTVK